MFFFTAEIFFVLAIFCYLCAHHRLYEHLISNHSYNLFNNTYMHRQQPLFSIITVTYNAADTVADTMQSVASQTFRDFEHIIVDGCSTDGTLEVVERYRTPETITFCEADRGIYDAMNKGLGEASGDYLIFLNAGDTFHADDTLEHYADAIEDNDQPGILYGQTDIVEKLPDGTRRRIGPRHLTAPAILTLDSFKNGMVVCHQSFVALRRLTSLYDSKYRFSADYDWCIRCLQHSRKNIYLDEVVTDYLAGGTTSKNMRQSLIERYRIMRFYYGTLPAIIRHIGFIPRFLKSRKQNKK